MNKTNEEVVTTTANAGTPLVAPQLPITKNVFKRYKELKKSKISKTLNTV